MDKNRMSNAKIISEADHFDPATHVHRIIGRMPEFQQAYGFWIINAGVAGRSGPDRLCAPRRFEFYSLSHLIEGKGRLILGDEREVAMVPGDAVLIAPGDLNRYGGTETEPYIEDSIRFCGPVADHMRRAGILRSGFLRMGMVRPIPSLQELIQDPSEPAQLEASMLLQKLLVDLYLENRRQLTPSRMEELLALIKNRPEKWWTVRELAEISGLSDDQLRRDFQRHTGMLPKRYLEELKLRLAAELLVSSRQPIAAVAKRFGYLDPYHFSRRFKHCFGVSPERYRRESPYLPTAKGL